MIRYLFQTLSNAQQLIAKVVEWKRSKPCAVDLH